MVNLEHVLCFQFAEKNGRRSNMLSSSSVEKCSLLPKKARNKDDDLWTPRPKNTPYLDWLKDTRFKAHNLLSDFHSIPPIRYTYSPKWNCLLSQQLFKVYSFIDVDLIYFLKMFSRKKYTMMFSSRCETVNSPPKIVIKKEITKEKAVSDRAVKNTKENYVCLFMLVRRERFFWSSTDLSLSVFKIQKCCRKLLSIDVTNALILRVIS